MPARIPQDRIQPAPPTVDQLKPGDVAWISVTSLSVSDQHELYVSGYASLVDNNDSLAVKYGMDADGKRYVDLSHCPDYKFKLDGSFVSLGIRYEGLLTIDYLLGP